MACCESFSKILLIIFNIIFFIFGGVILGVGIWAKVSKSTLFEMMQKIELNDASASFSNTSNQVIDGIAIALIVFGTFTFITGFCGCCGAIKESQCLLYMYCFLVSVVVIAEVGIGIYAGVQQSKFIENVQKGLASLIKTDFNGIAWTNSSMFTKVFTVVMLELQCCGSSGQSDFFNNTKWRHNINGQEQRHPVGCCPLKTSKNTFKPDNLDLQTVLDSLKDPKCPISVNPELNPDGCVTKVVNLIKQNLGIVIGVCVGLGLFEILCIVFACCVARKDD